jgi:heme oxygenase
MSTLKELTQHNHDLAEKHPFVNLLLGGEIPAEIYATYLANQYLQYQALELYAKDLFDSLPGLARTHNIGLDLAELNTKVKIFDSTIEYCDRLKTLNQSQLAAHVYTKHMGDLYGGQMIKRKVPGSGLMYKFEDRDGLIRELRSKLNVEMAGEANIAFESTLTLFDRIANEYHI